MAILQLSPQLPVETPKGRGFAFLVLDYSEEHDLYFVCSLSPSGEIWTFSNREVRLQANITLGRIPTPPMPGTPSGIPSPFGERQACPDHSPYANVQAKNLYSSAQTAPTFPTPTPGDPSWLKA